MSGDVVIRPARASDADAMCAVLNPIIAAGGTTAYRVPFSPERMLKDMIAPDRLIATSVADIDGVVAGFQMLEWADPTWPGPEVRPADWAVIATFVARGSHGQGIGTRLFRATLDAAIAAGVRSIDATIRHENTGGLAYYAGLGFVDDRVDAERVSKRYDLSQAP